MDGSKIKTPRMIVIVVEDEALIRLDAMMMLEDAGFDVVDASDADDALLLLKARADIAGLFTDVNMPGRLDGIALAHRARELHPDIRIVVTSGARKVDPAALPIGSHFVPKPYACAHVAALLAA